MYGMVKFAFHVERTKVSGNTIFYRGTFSR